MRVIEADSLKIDELKLYNGASETELFRCKEPDLGYFIAESPGVIERAINAGYVAESFLMESRYLETVDSLLAKLDRDWTKDVPIYTTSTEVLQGITGFPMTRGMLALMRRRNMPIIEDVCKDKKRIVVLDDVMNPTNVGAIFRSAAALYMEGIILTKGCADPLYRRASRVSMGTVFQIPWTMVETIGESVIRQLKMLGYVTVAMALQEDSVTLDDERLRCANKLAVVMGSEGYGMSQEAIECCDLTVKIPMSNNVDSLNVAAASAVAFYELGKK